MIRTWQVFVLICIGFVAFAGDIEYACKMSVLFLSLVRIES